jgi:phage FluMu protein Com
MPIEFRCHRCQKLLRTPDNTAGKQAQCPQCGEVQTIPPPAAVAPPPQQVQQPPRPGSPFDAPPMQQAAGSWGPTAGYNPYQSPQASLAPPIQPGPTWPRHGPPWEAEGPSPGSFWSTIKSFFSDLTGFFVTMRLQGGIGLPLLYMLICSVIGGAGYALQQAALSAIGIAMPGGMQNAAETGQAIAMIVGLSFCLAPLGAILMSFVMSAIYHAMLAMLGGANQGMETTYRVVAYTFGHSYLMYLIPCCGSQIGGLASIILTIIGLAYAHDTSGWRATGTVLIPMAVCCVAAIGLFAAAVGIGAAR